MPNVVMTLPETQQSISRPVISSIVEQIKAITKISKDTKVLFPGEIDKVAQPGSGGLGISSLRNKNANLTNQRRVFIEVEEDYDEDAIRTTAISRPEHIPFFNDVNLGVMLKPIYITSNVTINFSFKSNSRTEVLRWRDDIRVSLSNMRDLNLHDVIYHYGIPEQLLTLLKDIYKLRESNYGYGDTFEDYLKQYSSERLTVLSTKVGTNTTLVVGEKQMRIIGKFDFTIPDKVEKDDTNNTWVGKFTYLFSFEKPVSCNMSYPVMVHNQLLPAKYVDFIANYYNSDEVQKKSSLSIANMYNFEVTTEQTNLTTSPILRIPSFNELVPDNYQRGTVPVAYILTQLEDDKRTLLNLTDIGEYEIDPDVLEYIKSEGINITKINQSIFQVNLYRNNKLVNKSLTITPDLNIKSLTDLDFRDIYHIRLSLVKDFTLLSKETLNRFRMFPNAFVKILIAINQTLNSFPNFKDLQDKQIIKEIDLDYFYQIFTGTPLFEGKYKTINKYDPLRRAMLADLDKGRLEGYGIKTVQSSLIIAEKMEK